MYTLTVSPGMYVREPDAPAIEAALKEIDHSTPVVVMLKSNLVRNYFVSAEGSAESGFVLELKFGARDHYRAEPPYLACHELIDVLQRFIAGDTTWMSRFPFRRAPRARRDDSPAVKTRFPGTNLELVHQPVSRPEGADLSLNDLSPTGSESLVLPSSRVVRIPKCNPVFAPWQGPMPEDTYGGKAVLDIGGHPAFAELAILWLLQRQGWEGVWIDTFRRRFRQGYWNTQPVELPAPQATLLERVFGRSGTRSGAFDVFCWQGDDVLFAESKRQRHDAIRASQLAWLEAALQEGIRPQQFLIVEWTYGSALAE